jgi:hypothetical protein
MFNAYDEKLEPLYLVVGKIAVRWAWLEYMLDSCISLIFYRCGGDAVVRKLPSKLRPKLEFLVKCLVQIEVLSSFSVDGLRLVREMEDLRDQRNSLYHHMLYAFDENFSSFVYIQRKINEGSTKKSKSLEELTEATNKIEILTEQLTRFCPDLLSAFAER